jgi:cob(I)alamin adenosyltransferase
VVKIYTRTGDTGETSLFGGNRVSKGDDRIEAYGTLDELNAYLGWFRSAAGDADLEALAGGIQPVLFDIGAHLATPPGAEKARAVLPVLDPASVTELETAIDRLEGELAPLSEFVLPGGSEGAAILHVARAVCRRAERAVVLAGERTGAPLDPVGLAYLNRLSDLLFVMARAANRRAGVAEPTWKPRRPSRDA